MSNRKSPRRYTVRVYSAVGILQLRHDNMTERTALRYAAALTAQHPDMIVTITNP